MNPPRTTALDITRATPTDTTAIAAVIAEAFDPLAVCGWLIPDDEQRAARLPGYFEILVEHAMAHGYIHIAGDLAGVAVWLRRTGPVSDITDYPARLAAAVCDSLPRFDVLDEAFDRHHPASPHDHLALLAVRPDMQRQGIGGQLLAHGLSRLDDVGGAAYLEACDLESRRLYGKHGFTDLGDPMQLPDGPCLHPMWRPSQI
ncbi:GNAT family N-acetyltransferase [Longispora sp. K20-0274]|uniref:GNAT family N-acetyltransferase n=1 Tax=Longispora sp. K20-0274 TaxID=3088255 RepID=UPI00399ACCE9